jgi:hypothetical protein
LRKGGRKKRAEKGGGGVGSRSLLGCNREEIAATLFSTDNKTSAIVIRIFQDGD